MIVADTRTGRALERLGRWAWTLHNVVAHPLGEVLHQLGAARASAWLHDITVPRHETDDGGRG